MKYAWWFIFGIVLFLLCTQQALATEVVGFDPTSQYVVHSIPFVVPDAVTLQIDSSTGQPSNSTSNSQSNSGSTQTNSSGTPSNYATPSQANGYTTDAGTEAKLNSNYQGEVVYLANNEKSNAKIDLKELTIAGKSKKQSIFSSISNSVSSTFSSIHTGYINKVVKPVQTGVKNFADNFVQGFKAVGDTVREKSYQAIVGVSKMVNSVTGTLTDVIGKNIQFVRKHAFEITLFALTGTVSIPLMWKGLNTVGKGFVTPLVNFGKAGVVSLVDLTIHSWCLINGTYVAATTGIPVSEGYKKAKNFFKQKTGHDIGDFDHDFRVVAVRVAVIACLISSPYLISGTATIATAISSQTAPELILRGNYALYKTSTDCTTMVGQCDTVLSTTLTFGSNFVVGTAPNLAKLNTALADDEARAIAKVLGKSDDGAGVVSNVVGKTDEVVALVIRSDLEERAGKEFVQKVFGNAQGKEFDKLVAKWPDALKYIDESKGHAILKHVSKTEVEMIEQAISEGKSKVSSFTNEETFLNTFQKALLDKDNAQTLKNIKPGSKVERVRISIDGEIEIGKVYDDLTKIYSPGKKATFVIDIEENGSHLVTAIVN